MAAKSEIENIYLLTPMQEGILFHALTNENSPAYFEQYRIEVTGEMNPDWLQQCLNKLIEKHEVLRTNIVYSKVKKPVQVVKKKQASRLFYEDCSALSAQDRQVKLEAFVADDRARGFNLTKDPLIRLALFKKSAAQYLMVWSFHHIILDGWCLGILLKDFFDFYQMLKSGRAIQYTGSVPYSRYIEWVTTRDKEEALAYWEQYLSNYSEVVEVPAQLRDKAQANPVFSEHVYCLDQSLSSRIQSFAVAHNATVSTLFHCIWGLLLHRYNNVEDAVFGTVLSGRNNTIVGIEHMVGLFLNTVPLRVKCEPEQTIIELMADIQQQILSNQANSFCSINDIKHIAGITGDLINHLLVFENYPIETEIAKFIDGKDMGLTIDNIRVFEQTNYDFNVLITPSNEISIKFIYNSELYADWFISEIGKHMKGMLINLLDNPNLKVCELDIVTSGEQSRIKEEVTLNSMKSFYSNNSPGIHRVFEEKVKRHPHKEALVMGDKRITYQEFDARANEVAFVLAEEGVRANSTVGIVADRSFEMVIGIMGILKAGGAYVPISPGFTSERILYILEDSSAGVLLTTRRDGESIKGFAGKVIFLDELVATKLAGDRAEVEISPSDLAYIIYTSGSTGKPKGVKVSHESAVNLLRTLEKEYPVGERDCYMLKTTYTFDVSVPELFGWFFGSGSLTILEPQLEKDPKAIAAAIRQHKVSHINFVPSMLQAFLTCLDEEERIELNKLAYIFVAGEAINRELVNMTVKMLPNVQFINLYGPTEATVYATKYDLTQYSGQYANVPIGSPLANASIYIMDQHDRLQPVGIAGELYIGGAGVAEGYVNQEQLTAEKFVPNPYMAGTSMYKTGDIGRWLPDGNIEYLGRKDHQVKIRGYRIELGEIENRLLLHPSVREAVAAAKTEPEGGAYLCAYMVCRGEWTASGLREHLLQVLPDYMVPAYFTELDALPLSASGKVDRKALPDPERNRMLVDYAAARTENEQLLVDIWQQVLGIERIGIHDRFLELGGDSIKAIQVSARLQKHNRTIDVQDLLKYPTIGELSLYVRESDRKTQSDKEVEGHVALTPVQQWFFEQKLTDQHYWNQAYMLYRAERFEETKVRDVLEQIVLHHDALRMVYHQQENGIWTQYNRSAAEGQAFGWSVADIRGEKQPGPLIEREANALQASLSLEEGPLMKVKLFRTDEGDHLLIVIHHLVIDGVSWRILFEDFAAGYAQAMAGEAIVFQRKTESFQAWSERLRDYGSSKALMQEKSYWEKEESKAIHGLPMDYETESGSIRDSGTIVIEMGENETSQLIKQANKAYNTDANELLLTALGMSIKEWSGLKQVLVGLEAHGREQRTVGADVARTIGWFTSMYPLVMDLSETGDLGNLIRQTKEKIRAVPNKGVGYGVLRYVTEPAMRQELRFSLTPEISFNYLGQFDEDIQTEVFKKSAYGTGQPVSAAGEKLGLLNVNAVIMNKRLQLVLDYSRRQYKEQTMAKLTERLRSNLLTLLEHCMSKDKTQPTPSDFYFSAFSIRQLDDLAEETRRSMLTEIDQIYPMNAMQQGILYHSLLNQAANPYFQQMVIDIDGQLAIDHLQQAIDELVARHEALRSIFIYKNIDTQPVQLIKKWSKVNVAFVDLSMLNGDDHEQRFAQMKHSDLENGFDLSADTLMRLAAAKLADDSYRLIWSFHHVIMDGWCIGIILKEFFQIYEAILRNTRAQLQPVYAYQNYLEWSGRQDQEAARKYWTNYLSHFSVRTDLSCFRKKRTSDVYVNRDIEFTLDVSFTDELKRFASAQKVTLNCIFQTAWAILLAKYNDSSDVVFGTVVSGRPAEVKGIEAMVGIFINTIPVRVSFNTSTTCLELLTEMQSRSLTSSRYDYLPLYDILMLSEFKQDLIDHILVFENYPQDKQVKELGSNFLQGLSIKDVQIHEQTNYDFNIVVCPDEAIRIKLKFNEALYHSDLIEQIGAHLEEVLIQMAANVEASINSIVITNATGNFLDTSHEYTATQEEQYDF